MNDLLAQLTATIQEAERNQVDAEKWRQLVSHLGELGYGSRITPEQVAEIIGYLVDVNRRLTSLMLDTQEVLPDSPAANKSLPRRKLTDQDREAIDAAWQDGGPSSTEIARQLNLAPSAVEKYLASFHA